MTTTNSRNKPDRVTRNNLEKIKKIMKTALKSNDLKTWRRCRGVLDYYNGTSVLELVQNLNVVRSTVYLWLNSFKSCGADGLIIKTSTGANPKLSESQLLELSSLIDAGPAACNFTSSIWTAPMIGDLIHRKYAARYHNNYVPMLLHKMGFSLQRPRKKLSKADLTQQDIWLKRKLPAIKKKLKNVQE
ncbi:MAG TPA: transposase [Chromatiaceae bacterium]|nr:transposase [Chromatiaceae bacterium]